MRQPRSEGGKSVSPSAPSLMAWHWLRGRLQRRLWNYAQAQQERGSNWLVMFAQTQGVGWEQQVCLTFATSESPLSFWRGEEFPLSAIRSRPVAELGCTRSLLCEGRGRGQDLEELTLRFSLMKTHVARGHPSTPWPASLTISPPSSVLRHGPWVHSELPAPRVGSCPHVFLCTCPT